MKGIIYDNNGDTIVADDIDWIHTDDWRLVEVHLKDSIVRFDDSEFKTLIHVLSNEIESGVYVGLAKEYIKLLEKLQKMNERNCSK